MSGFTFLTASCTGADVAEESRASFAAVDAALGARGMTFQDIVRMRLLYTGRTDFAEMNSVREPLFRSIFADGGFPSSVGFITGGRGGSSPRFEVEVVACRGKRTAFSPKAVRLFGGVQPPFVHVTEAGGVAFVSGQTAFEPDGTYVARSPGDQARKVLATIEPILAEVDRSVEDVLAVSLFLGPDARGPGFADVRRALEQFLAEVGDPAPTVTCVGVEALIFEGMSVGVEAVAGAPAGVRTTAMGAIGPPPDLTPLSPRVSAARSGDLVTASVTVAADEPLVAIGRAAASLAEAIAEVTSVVAPGALVTGWFAPPVTHRTIELELGAALQDSLPDAVVTPVPMRPVEGSEAITLEVYASCSSTPSKAAAPR
jgi:enamine deaminase RidA (YjgF/YER057c/UK114 family)